MKTALALIARQLPWEKLAVGIIDRVVDRYTRGKIKRFPSQELLQSDADKMAILNEINRRIREGK